MNWKTAYIVKYNETKFQGHINTINTFIPSISTVLNPLLHFC